MLHWDCRLQRASRRLAVRVDERGGRRSSPSEAGTCPANTGTPHPPQSFASMIRGFRPPYLTRSAPTVAGKGSGPQRSGETDEPLEPGLPKCDHLECSTGKTARQAGYRLGSPPCCILPAEPVAPLYGRYSLTYILPSPPMESSRLARPCNHLDNIITRRPSASSRHEVPADTSAAPSSRRPDPGRLLLEECPVWRWRWLQQRHCLSPDSQGRCLSPNRHWRPVQVERRRLLDASHRQPLHGLGLVTSTFSIPLPRRCRC